jgi:hypothetical protein
MATEAEYLAIAGGEEKAVHFENGALTAPKETLPRCAQDVLDGRGASSTYWAWLIESFVACELAAKDAVGCAATAIARGFDGIG